MVDRQRPFDDDAHYAISGEKLNRLHSMALNLANTGKIHKHQMMRPPRFDIGKEIGEGCGLYFWNEWHDISGILEEYGDTFTTPEKGPYFKGPDGTKYHFIALGDQITREHPKLIGEHIFHQLDALGIRPAFDAGSTPTILPWSFSDWGSHHAQMDEDLDGYGDGLPWVSGAEANTLDFWNGKTLYRRDQKGGE